MNRFFFLTLTICVLTGSNAFGQGFFEQLGRELRGQIQQEFQLQQQNPPRQGGTPPIRGFGLPSESGGDSGGDERFINPGDDFALPGNGQPIQPGFPGGVDQFGRPVYPGRQVIDPSRNQPFQGQPRGTTQPRGTSYTDRDLPRSPEMTSQYIVIRCPESTAGSIYYLLSSERGRFGFTMTGGKEQRFKAGTNWTIGYNDGIEEKRYELHGGKTYTLKRKSDNRWQIYVIKSPGS